MKYDTVIWDFNGTIVDDVRLGIDSVNTMLSARGLPTVDSVDTYRSKMVFPISDYYRKLGFDFDLEPYADLALEWVKLYCDGEHTVKPCRGVEDALKMLRDAGLRQIIISASELSMMENSLRRIGLYEYFDEIIGQDNTFAWGKTESVKEYARRMNCVPVVIGDTLHDYEMAQALGADCILYTGGHGWYEKLCETPSHLVDDLRDAAGYIIDSR